MKSQQQSSSKVLWRIGAPVLIAVMGMLVVMGCDDRRDQAILPPPQNNPQAQPVAQAPPPQRRVDFAAPTTQWVQAPTNQPGTMALRILNTNPELIVQGFMIPRNADIGALVNKWEEVLGLPKSDSSTIQSSIIKTRVTHGGARAFTADLSSPANATEKKRLLAAIVPDDQTQQNVTFILLGPADAVDSERANFDQFVDSIQFQTVAPQATQGPMPAQPFRIRFASPPNWKQQQTNGSNGIDLVLAAPDGAAIVISRQTLQTGQQFVDNPNSLRAAAGLSPLPQGQKQQAYQVKIGNQEGLMFDLTSNPGETPAKHTLFSIIPQGGILVCIQLFGSVEQVQQHMQEYNLFLQSLTFIPMNPDGTEAASAGGAMQAPGALGPPSPAVPTTAPSQMMTSPQTQPSTAPAAPSESPLRLN
jgi:hypothetical protein